MARWAFLRIEGSKPQEMQRSLRGQGRLELEGCILVGRLRIPSQIQVLCPCPTAEMLAYFLVARLVSLTLHLRGRPLTLYPLSWHMAMAAFS